MKITDAFLGEHGILYAMLAYLEKTVEIPQSLDVIRGKAELLDSALSSHACIEDQLLFQALEPRMGPMGPLVVMRQEHDQIEKGLARIIREIQEVDQAKSLLIEVVQIALQHFAKEEQVLFPLAQQILDPQVLTELTERWAERRRISDRRYFE